LENSKAVAAGLIKLGRCVLALGILIAAITYLSNWFDRRRPALVGDDLDPARRRDGNLGALVWRPDRDGVPLSSPARSA
jgi:hypothetical protein